MIPVSTSAVSFIMIPIPFGLLFIIVTNIPTTLTLRSRGFHGLNDSSIVRIGPGRMVERRLALNASTKGWTSAYTDDELGLSVNVKCVLMALYYHTGCSSCTAQNYVWSSSYSNSPVAGAFPRRCTLENLQRLCAKQESCL